MNARRFLVLSLWPIAAASTALTACGGDGSEGPTSTVRDSAGVAVAESRGEDRPLGWTLRTVVRIGGGQSEDAFYRIGRHRVAAGSEGRIHVLDGGNRRVLVFGRDGSRVGELSGGGRGPGEIAVPGSMAVPEDGRILVLDPVGSTLMEWSPEGELLAERTLSLRLAGIEQPRPTGEQLEAGAASGVVVEIGGGARIDGDSVFTGVVRLGPDGDTALVAGIRRPRPEMQNYGCVALMERPLFAPEFVWHAAGTRVAAAEGDTYEVRFFEHGELARIVRREVSRVRATEEMAREALGNGILVRTPRRNCSISADELLEERDFVPRLPAIDGVALSPDGTLWVRRPTGHDESAVDVFDPEGRYRGTVEGLESLPADFLSPDTAVFVREDTLGVERLEVVEVLRN